VLKNKNMTAITSWIAVILWMILIFILSAQPAAQSSGLSKKVTEIIIEIVHQWIPLDIESSTMLDLASKYNHTVRKLAHFFAYFILAILVMNATIKSGVRGAKGIIIALLICVFYAISDEVHQLFVPGRGGQVKDVLIDSAGASFGVVIYISMNSIVNRLKIRKINYKQ